jgi:hypothetical protein
MKRVIRMVFRVLTAMHIKSTPLCDVTPCRLLESYQYLKEIVYKLN